MAKTNAASVSSSSIKKIKKVSAATNKNCPKGKHWSDDQVEMVLNIIKEVLPRGQYDWDKVVSQYNSQKPEDACERDEDAIRSKYKKLKNAKKPTGDRCIIM